MRRGEHRGFVTDGPSHRGGSLPLVCAGAVDADGVHSAHYAGESALIVAHRLGPLSRIAGARGIR